MSFARTAVIFRFNTFNVFELNFFCTEIQQKVRFAYKNFTLIKIKFTDDLVGLNKKEKCNKAQDNGNNDYNSVRKKIPPYKPYPTREYEKKTRKKQIPRLHDPSLKFCQEFEQS